jgi:hypothetical protein
MRSRVADDSLGAHQVVESLLPDAAASKSYLLMEPGGSLLGSAPQLGGIDQLGLPSEGSLLKLLVYALDSPDAPVQVGQCALTLLVPVNSNWHQPACVIAQGGLFPA